MRDLNSVGRTLARVRDAQNVSQRELAAEMQLAGFDTSRDRIMNLERDRADVTIGELAEMGRILNTRRFVFPPGKSTGASDRDYKRRLPCKVIVIVEFPDDPKPSRHQVRSRK